MNQDERIAALEKRVTELDEKLKDLTTNYWLLKKSDKPFEKIAKGMRQRGKAQLI